MWSHHRMRSAEFSCCFCVRTRTKLRPTVGREGPRSGPTASANYSIPRTAVTMSFTTATSTRLLSASSETTRPLPSRSTTRRRKACSLARVEAAVTVNPSSRRRSKSRAHVQLRGRLGICSHVAARSYTGRDGRVIAGLGPALPPHPAALAATKTTRRAAARWPNPFRRCPLIVTVYSPTRCLNLRE